jgi:hypothetical protein
MNKLNKIKVFITLVIFLLSVYSSTGQESSSYEGKHYFIGFMQNEIPDFEPLLLEILIVSNYPADIKVNIPGEDERFYNIMPDSVLIIDINPSLEITEVERIVKKSIEIISNVPILVYVFNSQRASSDCFTALPVDQWGNEYVIMSYPNDQYIAKFDYGGRIDSSNMIPRKSEFLILAYDDNTRIQITPTTPTQSLRPANKPHWVTLQKGDVYLVQSYDFGIGNGDLTGTILWGEKPFGVISGHMRTSVPQFMDMTYESKDHLADMLIPVSSWGRQFYSVPFKMHDGGDMFRITAAYSNTVVSLETIDTSMVFNLNGPGSFVSVPGINKPAKWTSNNPVQIGQMMMRIGGDFDHLLYDPCLVILPSAEQFVSKMIFQTVGNEPLNPEQYVDYAVYLVADNESINTLRLDGELIMNLDTGIFEQSFPNSKYKWTSLYGLSKGKHIITCETGQFSGVTFAYGWADSYALTLGSSLSKPYVNDTIAPEIYIEEYCGEVSGTITEMVDSNSSGLLFVVMTENSNNYNFELQEPILDSTYFTTFKAYPKDNMKPGKLSVEYRDKNGYGGRYSFDYSGINVELPGTISFGVVDRGDTICKDYYIENVGTQPVRLDSVVLKRPSDLRIDFIPESQPPLFLSSGEKYNFQLCFHPYDTFEPLKQIIKFHFECDISDSTTIVGSVNFPEIAVTNYNFGDVCLGDTVYGEVKIYNNGNVPVLIDSIIKLKLDTYISLMLYGKDSTKIIPCLIEPGDSLVIPALFGPMTEGSSELIIMAGNDQNIYNEIHLIGRGIAPEIHSIELNWGKRRIGSINDTVFYLHNIGNCDVEIASDGHDGCTTPFMTDSIENIWGTVKYNDSLRLFASFSPEELRLYQLKSFFEVFSPNHEQVIVDMWGEGTLPVIEPISVEFDTIDIFSFVDTMAILLKSKGNEKLWFDLISMAGDDSSFTINNNDLSVMRDSYLEPDSNLVLKITFHPRKLGFHELALVISHDALPSFQTGDTLIYLRGNARKVDTNSALIGFEEETIYTPCLYGLFPVYINNNGNVSLRIDSLEFETDGIYAEWYETIELPYYLEPDESIKTTIKILPTANKDGKICIKTVFNDTLRYITDFVDIKEVYYPLTVENIGELKYTIGKTAQLELSGFIPHRADIPVGFELSIQLAHKYLHLLENSYELELDDKSGTERYALDVKQHMDYIEVKTINDMIIKDSCRWKVNLDFLTLLSDSVSTEIKAEARMDLCYSPCELILNPEFLGVCSFEIRRITNYENDEPEVKIAPNPLTNELCIKINLKQKDEVNISIFDQNGKKMHFSKNLYLKKGLHSLIFEISPMASGTYILSVRMKFSMKNIKFMITK